MTGMPEIERQAARLLVLSEDGRALLLHVEPDFRDAFWVTPGGGLDEGETFEQAAMRELREEVGRDDLELGPWIWTRTVAFTWEEWSVRQEEHTYLIRVPEEFDPVVVHPDLEPITGGAWFDPIAIRTSAEVVYPEDLASVLEDLILHGPPTAPKRLPDGT